MAIRRLTRGGPSPCPACDAEVPAAVADEPSPACPACGTPLLPTRVAGFWRRAGAVAIDGLILGLTAVPLNLLLLALISPPPLVEASTPMGVLLELADTPLRSLLGRAAPTLVMTYVYFVLFWTMSGATIGMRRMGVRVVDGSGETLSPAAAALRAVVHALGLLPAALGSLWIAFDLEKRAWHDKVADSYVIRVGSGGST